MAAKRGEAAPKERTPLTSLAEGYGLNDIDIDTESHIPWTSKQSSFAEIDTDYIAIYSRIASAQMTLPVIATLELGTCFSFYNYYGTAYAHLNATTAIGWIAQCVFIVALSIASVCSAYATTFFVLEAYYLQLIVSVEEFNTHTHKASNKEQASVQQARAELAESVSKIWGKFIPHRNAARSALWTCLSLLFISAACELVVDGDVNIITLIGVALLLTGVFFVWRLVIQFRMAYKPLLAKAQGVHVSQV